MFVPDNIWESLKRKELSGHLDMQINPHHQPKSPSDDPLIHHSANKLAIMGIIIIEMSLGDTFSPRTSTSLPRSFLDRSLYQLPIILAPESYQKGWHIHNHSAGIRILICRKSFTKRKTKSIIRIGLAAIPLGPESLVCSPYTWKVPREITRADFRAIWVSTCRGSKSW